MSASASTAPGRNYFLAGPAHTIVEAIDIASAITGLPRPRQVSPRVLRGAARIMRIVETMIALPPVLASESLRVLGGVTYLGSSARARDELRWTARPLREGLAETLRHEQQLQAR